MRKLLKTVSVTEKDGHNTVSEYMYDSEGNITHEIVVENGIVVYIYNILYASGVTNDGALYIDTTPIVKITQDKKSFECYLYIDGKLMYKYGNIDGPIVTKYKYNNIDQLIYKEETTGYTNAEYSYKYSEIGTLSEILANSPYNNKRVLLEYHDNMVKEVEDGGDYLVHHKYDSDGNILKTVQYDGTLIDYTYTISNDHMRLNISNINIQQDHILKIMSGININ